MPRSGRTLLEQILARHFGAALAAVGDTRRCPDMVTTMHDPSFRHLGERYVGALRAMAGLEPACITDKVPTNYLFAGLIHLALCRTR